MRRRWIGVIMAGLIAAGSGAWAASKKDLTRRDSRAAVTVSVTYLNPLEKGAKDTLDFAVEMNTHSVDLDPLKVEELAVLRAGKAEVKPLGWSKPEGGGHHRSGVLRFPAKDASGKPLLPERKGKIELRIKGVGSPGERVFAWELPVK